MARKTKAQRKERRKKILSKVRKGGKLIMKVSMIATRGAFLSAVSLNAFNLSKRLTQLMEKNPDAVPHMWNNFGGEMKSLEKAIKKGLAHREKHAKKKGERQQKRGKGKVNGELGEPYTVAGIIAIALPIVTATIKMFTTHKSDKKGDADKDSDNVQALKNALIKNTPDEILKGKTKEDAGSGIMSNKPLLIGGALALVVGGYFLMKKK